MKPRRSFFIGVVLLFHAADAAADEPAPVAIASPPRGLSLVMEIVFGRSLPSLGSGRELALRGAPELRQPQWWGPDPPKPPALHVRLIRVSF